MRLCMRCGEPAPAPVVAKRALFVRLDGTALAGPDPDRDYWQVPYMPPESRTFSFKRDEFSAPMVSVISFRRVSHTPPVFVEDAP